MASFSVPCPKTCTSLGGSQSIQAQQQNHHRSVSFQPDLKSKASLFGLQGSNGCSSNVLKLKALRTEVHDEKASNSVAVPKLKTDETTKTSTSQSSIADAEYISTFMNQVSDLVKLVDSKDIMELQIKQMDCEILIRKKEALAQATVSSSVSMMQSPLPSVAAPSLPTPQLHSGHAAPVFSPPVPVTAPSTPAKPKSSHPPLKCPMAGTFYLSPAPGAPPFVKVGDKVQKGQVVCIIEAMKLMNEIEADQAGTVVEIIALDGKPVSLDTPLFIIEP